MSEDRDVERELTPDAAADALQRFVASRGLGRQKTLFERAKDFIQGAGVQTLEVKGFTLTQPWATLVALRAKMIETRSWNSNYRGLIAVHAAKGFPADCQSLCHRDPFVRSLIDGGFDRAEQLPRGTIVAVARVVDVVSTEHIIRLWQDGRAQDWPEGRERPFGDYGPRRFAWLLADVRPLKEPIACTGALGLWALKPPVRAALDAQLRSDA